MVVKGIERVLDFRGSWEVSLIEEEEEWVGRSMRIYGR